MLRNGTLSILDSQYEVLIPESFKSSNHESTAAGACEGSRWRQQSRGRVRGRLHSLLGLPLIFSSARWSDGLPYSPIKASSASGTPPLNLGYQDGADIAGRMSRLTPSTSHVPAFEKRGSVLSKRL